MEPQEQEVRVEAVTPIPQVPEKKTNSNKGLVVVLMIVCFLFLVTIIVLVFMIYSNSNPTKTNTTTSATTTEEQSSASMQAGNSYTSEELGISFMTNDYFNNPKYSTGSSGLFIMGTPFNDEKDIKSLNLSYILENKNYTNVSIIITKFTKPAELLTARNTVLDNTVFNCDMPDSKGKYLVSEVKYDSVKCAYGGDDPVFDCPIVDPQVGDTWLMAGSIQTKEYVFVKDLIIEVAYENSSEKADGKCEILNFNPDPKSLEAAKDLIESIKYL